MIFKALLIVSLSLSVQCIRLRVLVDRNEGVCFYENLQKDQKYLFKIEADNANYRMDVMVQDQSQRNGWKEVASKVSKRVTQQINKIAQNTATYTFCISSSQQRPFKANFELQSKLQLANFDYLPSLSDHENLDRQIGWMQRQKQKMFQIFIRAQNFRSSSDQVKSMMGVTMVVLAILGVVIIAAVNVMFYTLAKRTLKDRKLI